MRRRLGVPAAVAVAWLACAGCTAGEPATSAAPEARPDGADLPPITLPDLSPLAESVQDQLRELDARLRGVLEDERSTAAERAAAYGAFGRLLMASTFNGEAAACYLHAEALAPRDVRWPYSLGHAYLRKGDRARAAAAFERAAALAPADPSVLVWLGETYLDDGRPEAALPVFERAAAMSPPSAAALFGAGRAALAQQSYREAAGYMERALAADATASAIHYPLAMAYRALGDAEKTARHLQLRGQRFPALPDPLLQEDEEILQSAVAYENLGMEALRAADWTSAQAAFQRALDLDPDSPSLRYWLGAARYAAGDAAGAERDFLAVVRLAPDFANAHFSLGAIYEASGRRREALDAYGAAVEHDPALPEARLRLADLLRAAGRLDASLEQYEAAVRLDPGLAPAWSGGAQALDALGRDDEAKTWTAQAARLRGSAAR